MPPSAGRRGPLKNACLHSVSVKEAPRPSADVTSCHARLISSAAGRKGVDASRVVSVVNTLAHPGRCRRHATPVGWSGNSTGGVIVHPSRRPPPPLGRVLSREAAFCADPFATQGSAPLARDRRVCDRCLSMSTGACEIAGRSHGPGLLVASTAKVYHRKVTGPGSRAENSGTSDPTIPSFTAGKARVWAHGHRSS